MEGMDGKERQFSRRRLFENTLIFIRHFISSWSKALHYKSLYSYCNANKPTIFFSLHGGGGGSGK